MRTFKQYILENLERIYEDYQQKRELVKHRQGVFRSFEVKSKTGRKVGRKVFGAATKAVGKKRMNKAFRGVNKFEKKMDKIADKGMKKIGYKSTDIRRREATMKKRAQMRKKSVDRAKRLKAIGNKAAKSFVKSRRPVRYKKNAFGRKVRRGGVGRIRRK